MRPALGLLLPTLAAAVTHCGVGSQPLASLGFCDGYAKTEESAYVLPFGAGFSSFLGQGNCTSISHYGAGRYAFDFGMPIGTEIVAARSGTVIAAVGDNVDGNRCPNPPNHIDVQHDDGTVAIYFHLTHDGALAQVGTHVEQGEVIALSGLTGCTSGPHLHFHVVRGKDSSVTVPVSFRNVDPPHRQLQGGRTYTAKAPD